MILLLLALAVLALAVLLLSVRIVLQRGGRFPNTHVGGHEALRRQGISCHTSQHRDAQRQLSLAERLEARRRAEA